MSDPILDKVLEIWADDEEDMDIIKRGGWVSDGKYQHRETIVQYNNEFFGIQDSRSGSYHSDYEYGDPIAYRVRPEQVVITKWVEVK